MLRNQRPDALGSLNEKPLDFIDFTTPHADADDGLTDVFNEPLSDISDSVDPFS